MSAKMSLKEFKGSKLNLLWQYEGIVLFYKMSIHEALKVIFPIFHEFSLTADEMKKFPFVFLQKEEDPIKRIEKHNWLLRQMEFLGTHEFNKLMDFHREFGSEQPNGHGFFEGCEILEYYLASYRELMEISALINEVLRTRRREDFMKLLGYYNTFDSEPSCRRCGKSYHYSGPICPDCYSLCRDHIREQDISRTCPCQTVMHMRVGSKKPKPIVRLTYLSQIDTKVLGVLGLPEEYTKISELYREIVKYVYSLVVSYNKTLRAETKERMKLREDLVGSRAITERYRILFSEASLLWKKKSNGMDLDHKVIALINGNFSTMITILQSLCENFDERISSLHNILGGRKTGKCSMCGDCSVSDCSDEFSSFLADLSPICTRCVETNLGTCFKQSCKCKKHM